MTAAAPDLTQQQSSSEAQTSMTGRWLRFAVAFLSVAAIWRLALPWVESYPQVSEHIATQKKLGVDPSAMFYTELEISSPIAHHVERLQEWHGNRFWNPENPRAQARDKSRQDQSAE